MNKLIGIIDSPKILQGHLEPKNEIIVNIIGTGRPGKDGKDGKDGIDGENGYTPIKGIDYFTEEDKREIIDQVESEIDQDVRYIYHQRTAEEVWIINHNLGKFPSVTIVDSAGSVVIPPSPIYIDENTIILEFHSAFSGKAYLN